VEHKVKRLYVKKAQPDELPAAPGSFMGDARSSDSGKFVSSNVSRKVKKLSWFQKHVLCMKVEIHRENKAYRECKVILHNQQKILHKLNGKKTALPKPSPAIAYNKWNTDSYDWAEIWKGPSLLVVLVVPLLLKMLMMIKTRRKRRRKWRSWTTRMTTIGSDLLGRVASLFSPLWCLDAKGGEVVLVVSSGNLHCMVGAQAYSFIIP
jgi:hypothetical protein